MSWSTYPKRDSVPRSAPIMERLQRQRNRYRGSHGLFFSSWCPRKCPLDVIPNIAYYTAAMGSSVSIQRPRVSPMGFRGRFLSSQSFREITLISTVMSFSRSIRMRSSLEFLLCISSSPWSLWKSDVVTGEPRQLSSHRGGPCRSVVCKLDLGTKPRGLK
jgi:hypothetical protein